MVQNVTGDIRERFGSMDMFVRCKDVYGDVNTREYAINFCIKTGKDETPPGIVATYPLNKSYFAFNQTSLNMTLFVNEPAECKYDVIENKSYDSMNHSMNCNTNITDLTSLGWSCNTTLNGLNLGENDFYIKCKDQPWFKDTVNETDRNSNSQSYHYMIFGSETPLKIISLSPEGEIEEGFEPISVDLEARTEGGSESGASVCYYSFIGYDNMQQFYNTFSNYHKQNFNMMTRGNYKIYVKCVDGANNIATDDTRFELKIDSTAPEIVRVYRESDRIVLITDEEAQCYYDFDRCNFNIANATSMTTAYSTSHSAEFISGETYHIKCKDIWGNTNPDCAIIIKADEI
jgi:hypothetical protein